jgi:sterol desaturase/sphingolipid hydroxylase (fatty acid hydroxylase superfamily)
VKTGPVILSDDIISAFEKPYRNFVSWDQGFAIQYLLCAFLLTTAWLLWKNRRKENALHKVGTTLFPRRIFTHQSAMADYQFYVIGAIIMGLISGYVLFSSAWLDERILKGLTAAFGPRVPIKPNVLVLAVETILYVVLFDFGYWLSHWLMHKLPWLWELHKSHHSAEVLTSFTTLRTHPYERVQEGNLIILSTSPVHAAFTYFYGPAAHDFQLWQVNIILLAYFATVHNLRHTHIWLPIRGPLARVFQSPAHHQIHHSTSKRHLDRNFGLCLAVWDWMFGTLYIPEKEQEDFKLGIGKESAEYHSVSAILFLPFVKIARRIRGETY